MIVVVGSTTTGLIAVRSSSTASATRAVSIVPSTACAIASTTRTISTAVFLIERHAVVLFVGGGRLVRVHEVNQHIIGLADGFGKLIDPSHVVILGAGNERSKTLCVRMSEEHHSEVLLADGQDHGCSNALVLRIVAVLHDACGYVRLVRA